METLAIVVIVAVIAYCVRFETIKVHRASIREDIEKSIMKSYKPKTEAEKKRWKEILKEIDES